MKCCGIRKREKQRAIAPKDAGTEEAYEENLELYEQLTGSLIMQNPDRSETISQNAVYLQRFVIFYSSVSSSLPRVGKRANVCRRTINIKETQKHEKPLNIQGLSLSNNPKFQARFRGMSFVLAKNVYKLIKALYW